jgi:hypothetical protein
VLPAAITLATAAGSDSIEDDLPPKGDELSQTIALAQASDEAQPQKSKQSAGEEEDNPTENLADRFQATPRSEPRGSKTAPGNGAAPRPARSTDTPRIARADASEPPAITITEGPNGQLIVTSEDLEALDAVEKLIAQIMPRQADYEVFRLRHASPYAIELTLSQIFGVSSFSDYGARSGMQMGARPVLQFVSDVDTGTLLVQGATPEQLRKISQLIELYDQPETLHEDLQRKTEIYEVKFSRADSVAEVVKEVYRDLLSVNDKAFTRERGNENGRSNSTLGYGTNYATRIPQFRGLLSIGVEQPSNTLVVSAPEYLIGDVMKLIRDVDERSAGHKPRVVQLNGLGSETLRSVLAQIPGVTVSAPGSAAGSGQRAPSFSGSSRPSSFDRDNGEASFSGPSMSRGEFGNRGGAFGNRGGDFGSRNRTGVGGQRFESNSGRGEGSFRRGGRD